MLSIMRQIHNSPKKLLFFCCCDKIQLKNMEERLYFGSHVEDTVFHGRKAGQEGINKAGPNETTVRKKRRTNLSVLVTFSFSGSLGSLPMINEFT